MARGFSPELISSDDPEAKTQYDLICFQLAVTIEALKTIKPNASFTKSDLVTYYSLQYGGSPRHINDTVNGVLGDYWNDTERVRSLKRLLPGMVTGQTHDAVMAQIMMGSVEYAETVEIDNELDQWMIAVDGESPHHDDSRSLCLRPDKYLELEYKRRIALSLGKAAAGQRTQNLAGYIDAVTLTEKATDTSRTILVVSRCNPHRVEQVRAV